MNIPSTSPDENTAATVATSMLGEKVLSSIRVTTGDQHFVFAVKTASANDQKLTFNVSRLNNMFNQSLTRIKEIFK